MSVTDGIGNVDIVLDDQAFTKAIEDFEALGRRLQTLRTDVEEMLNILKAGFRTPAGVKFITSCEANIFEPLDDQAKVIQHIKDTLQESKQSYDSVFREYESLQTKIKNIKKG